MQGRTEEGRLLFRSQLDRVRGDSEPNWFRHHYFFFAAALLPEEGVDWAALSQAEFERLVPETFSFEQFRANLRKFCSLVETEKRICFRLDDRVMNADELAQELWLPEGYWRWINVSFNRKETDDSLEFPVACGGIVDSPREMLHHEDGYPPFH